MLQEKEISIKTRRSVTDKIILPTVEEMSKYLEITADLK